MKSRSLGLIVVALLVSGLLFAVFTNKAGSAKEEPLDALSEVSQTLSDQVEVVPEKNALVFILGFWSEVGADPIEKGLERLQSETTEFGESDSVNQKPEVSNLVPSSYSEYRKSCGTKVPDCWEALLNVEKSADGILSDSTNLIDRYQRMLALTQYQTQNDERVGGLFGFVAAQEIYFLEIYKEGIKSGRPVAAGLISEDLQFWRMVMANEHAFIMKMVAKALVDANFRMGNSVLSKLPGELSTQNIPSNWEVSFSSEEVSVKRMLYADWEYQFSKSLIAKKLVEDGYDDEEARVITEKIQAFKSNSAERVLQIVQEIEQPPVKLHERVKAYQDTDYSYDKSVPVEDQLIEIMTDGFHELFLKQAYKFAATENVRRAAVLAEKLRSKNASQRSIKEVSESNDLKDVFTGEDLSWDESKQCIQVFYDEKIAMEPTRFCL